MKKTLSKIHLYLSLPVGLIISIICLTGAAMVFDADIHRWTNPHLFVVEKAEGNPLQLSELSKMVTMQVADANEVASVKIFPDSLSTYQFFLAGLRPTYYVDPYTGELLGERNRFKEGGFYRTMFYMHRWLMDGSRNWGKLATGISTILLVIILITGVIIWVPKNIKMLKKRLSINVTKGWKIFWYDLHVSGGIYITGWLLLLGLTGLMWSFPWYRSSVYTVFDVDPTRKKIEIPAVSDAKTMIDFALWDKVSANVLEDNKNIQSIVLKAGEARVYDKKYGNTRSYKSYFYNTQNGNIEKIIPYSDRAESSRFMGWVYAIHVGSWGGMISKIITFLVALFGGILPITGYYLWIKRTIRNRANYNTYKKTNRKI